ADAFVDATHPERLSVIRIDRNSDAALGGHGEQPSVGVQRRGAEVLVRAERRRSPLPRDLERVEVARVDLVERRVAGAPGVTAPVAPLSGNVAANERAVLRGK